MGLYRLLPRCRADPKAADADLQIRVRQFLCPLWPGARLELASRAGHQQQHERGQRQGSTQRVACLPLRAQRFPARRQGRPVFRLPIDRKVKAGKLSVQKSAASRSSTPVQPAPSRVCRACAAPCRRRQPVCRRPNKPEAKDAGRGFGSWRSTGASFEIRPSSKARANKQRGFNAAGRCHGAA